MKHYYDKIQGFVGDEVLKFYPQIVKIFPSGSKFVEIGTWMGKSTSCLAVEIFNSGKDIELYTIDTWQGSQIDETDKKIHQNYIDKLPKSLYQTFIDNMEPVKHIIKPIVGSSLYVHNKFEKNSIDFLYIDDEHTADHIIFELAYWYPKMKKNGIIAGHDYNWDGVKKAVDYFFDCIGKKVNTYKGEFTTTWYVDPV